MRRLRLITLVTALFYAALGSGMPFMGLFLETLGASYRQISLIFTLFMAVSIAASALYGRYGQRMGRRRDWLVAGLAMQAAALLLFATSGSLAIATGARVLEGIGSALYFTVSLAMVGELLHEAPRRGRIMGIYRGMGSLAFAGGALLGGALANRLGMEWALLTGAGFFAAAALLALLLPPGPRPHPRLLTPVAALAEAGGGGAGRARLPWFFLSGVLLLSAAIAATSSMAPLYFDRLGRTKFEVGALWSLAAALELPAMWITGLLSDAAGRAPLLALGGLAVAALQLLYAAAARAGWLLPFAQSVRALGYASYTANAMTFTVDVSTEQDRAANSGLYNVVQSAGSLVGMALGGTLVQALGFSFFFAFTAGLALAGTVSFLSLRAFERARRPAAAAP